MPYVKFTGNYGAFITGRDVDSAVRYEDESDQTCVGFVPAVREGDEEIDEAEYESLKTTILAANEGIPAPPERPRPPEREVATEQRRAAAMRLYMTGEITREQLEQVTGQALDTSVSIPSVEQGGR